MQGNSECDNKIKKFKSAYIIFSEDFRRSIKSQNIKLSSQEITKKIAETWKTLSETIKNEYREKEQKGRELFENKKKEAGTYKYKKNIKNVKPKRFRTPFMFFMMSHREHLRQNEKFKNIDMIKSLSERWNLMNEEEKKEYELLAKSDKIRYDNEMEVYINHMMIKKPKKLKKKEKIEKINLKLNIKTEDEMGSNEEKIFIQEKRKRDKTKFPFSITKSERSLEKNIVERSNFYSDEEDYQERLQMGEFYNSNSQNISKESCQYKEQLVLPKSYRKK
jgi:hypothetical protein